ncbi:MAG: NAD(P)/FAD-dependent oxidoreductase [Candidatus Obscuribacterales bacterium]|nr:NAD(P)/FAD-dependent oxidoreductase [Candidatus Obscuribacterales bacterium]
MSSTVSSSRAKNLSAQKALEEAVKRDLDLLDYPRREWVISRESSSGQKILDVLIIGAGQGGLASAFGLMREKVKNILVVDQNPQGEEGPWLTFARMHTLRTPKYLTGPDLGIPNLTPRNWYETVYGKNVWDDFSLIPKEHWAEYLQWYREVLGIPVRNNTAAGAIEWNEKEKCFNIPLTDTLSGKTENALARKVVLATGIDGSGRWDVPVQISESLTRQHYAHTRDDIDFEKLKGKSIAVLGAGASAFDNASVAMEHGAKEIHLFYRREDLPNINPYRWAEFVGFLKHHGDMPDHLKWKFILQILRMGQLPPTDTYHRATKNPNFHLHGNSIWNSVKAVNGHIEIDTKISTFKVDYIIVGTGCVTDLSLRPELSKIVDKIALWQDRYSPPAEDKNADLARHPYLAPQFQFTEKNKGEAPYLDSIFNYTFGCLLSLGFGGASISGMKYSIQRLVSGITKQLYLEDADAFYEQLKNFDLKEF